MHCQKNGSLEEGALQLFEEANLKVFRAPGQHEQGTYDLGVCDQDCILTSDPGVAVLRQFYYSRRTLGAVQVVPIDAGNDTTPRTAHVSARVRDRLRMDVRSDAGSRD
jgi:hypothetical protein